MYGLKIMAIALSVVTKIGRAAKTMQDKETSHLLSLGFSRY
jgi:hypothetical protein